MVFCTSFIVKNAINNNMNNEIDGRNVNSNHRKKSIYKAQISPSV